MTDYLRSTFGERLKKCREEKGMTQEQLGEKCGISANWVSQFETNARKPSLEKFLVIIKALDYPTDLL